MVAQRSLLFAAASAFTVSNVFAHPHAAHAAHHAHQHAKRQDELVLSYVTLYQTQPAGPSGTAVVYTLTSPVWVPAGAAATGAVPVINSTRPVATPILAPSVSSTAIAVPTSSKVAGVQPSISLDEEAAIASSTVVEVLPSASPFAVVDAPPASSVVAPVATPISKSPSGGGDASGAYKEYSGVPSEFPTESEWLSFEAIFEASKGDSSKGMAAHGITEEQMSSLSSGIQAAATKADKDPRIVLVLVMQETQGDATKPGGGLIQASRNNQLCTGSWSNIEEQLECGLGGVYAECAAKYPDNIWYQFRCYNSGPNGVVEGNLNQIESTGTASYCTDMANRLVNGWTN